jgi:hypothetical protein
VKTAALAICLLCCGRVGAQTTATCVLGHSDPTAHCCPDGSIGTWAIPCKSEAPRLGAKQLICDWQTDHWYCPTREAVATENTALLYGDTVQRFPPFDISPVNGVCDKPRFLLKGHCLALTDEFLDKVLILIKLLDNQ